MSNQEQKSGDHSVNVMAGAITYNGLTYSEAKSLFLDLFRANFPVLQQIAKETAEERAQQLISNYVDKLASELPDGLTAAKDPDMQYAIFSAQKAYARSGKKELGDLLVDILIQRTKENGHELKKIVLNESLDVVHKLTPAQIDSMTIKFLIASTVIGGINSIESLNEFFRKYISPLCSNLSKNLSDYQHLVYAGCGTVSIGRANIHSLFTKRYQGVLTLGFDEKDIADIRLNPEQYKKILATCLRDDSKIQLNCINESEFDRLSKEIGLSNEQASKLKSLNNRLVSQEDFEREIISQEPAIANLFAIWKDSQLGSFELTSVGIAISIANIKRKIGVSFDLSKWIT